MKKIHVIASIFLVFAFILISRMYALQVVNDDYKDLAESISIRKVTTYPLRGSIFDRNGKLLIDNQPVYDIMVVPRAAKGVDTMGLCKLIGITREQYNEKMQVSKTYSWFKSSVFEKQLSPLTYAQVQESLHKYPGFYAQTRTIRNYQSKSAPHIFGYLGEVSKRDMEKNEYYELGDYVGKTGIEKQFEEHLRGVKGEEYFVVDKFNRIQSDYKDGSKNVPAQSGKNLQLTIDIDLQEYGQKLMKNKIGSLIAIEPSSGEILAMLSGPDYDPTLLTTRERGQVTKMMASDPLKPELNRCITAFYPPGSTFKPMVALIGLEEGVIYPNTFQKCGQYYPIGRSSGVRCSHAHKSCGNIQCAIEQSCNPYFCEVFHRSIMNRKYESIDSAYLAWYDYVRSFGFGEKADIGLPGGIKGNIPSLEYYNKIYKGWRWKAKTIISLSIGQGEITATPIQLAQYTAILANRGVFMPAHVFKTEKPVEAREISISPTHFEPVIQGMEDVMLKGTGRYNAIPNISSCGKTGTVENNQGDGEDHSVFIGFAPKDNPQIAVIAIIENGGYGSTAAAPIVTLMMEKYISGTIDEKSKYKEQKILEKDFITPRREALNTSE